MRRRTLGWRDTHRATAHRPAALCGAPCSLHTVAPRSPASKAIAQRQVIASAPVGRGARRPRSDPARSPPRPHPWQCASLSRTATSPQWTPSSTHHAHRHNRMLSPFPPHLKPPSRHTHPPVLAKGLRVHPQQVCAPQRGTCLFCMGSKLKRRLQMSRCLENLSSGEKRAGCADTVGLPSGDSF